MVIRYNNILRYSLLIVLSSICIIAYGRTPRYYSARSESFVGFSLATSYAANPSSIKGLTIDKGYAVDFSLLYEYHKFSYVINTGVNLQWQKTSERFNDLIKWDEQMFDTQGDPYTLNYSLLRRDYQSILHLGIPFLFGEFIPINHTSSSFYYLIGPKVCFNLLGNTQQHLRITTTATYDQYFNPLWGMANHGLRTDVHQVYRGDRFNYTADLRLCCELGFYVYEGRGLGRTKSIIKLGAFAEGGIILSPTTNINEPLIEFTTPFDYSEWATCNVLSNSSAKDHVIGSLNAGLKLTIMFTQGSTRYNNGYRRDVGCAECNEEKPRRRKHKCVMCEEEKIRRKKHKCVMCDYE